MYCGEFREFADTFDSLYYAWYGVSETSGAILTAAVTRVCAHVVMPGLRRRTWPSIASPVERRASLAAESPSFLEVSIDTGVGERALIADTGWNTD